MKSDRIQLYGIGKTRWNRPYWLLQEMGLEFEPVVIDPRVDQHLTPEFRALNPNCKLPVLVDGDRVLFESAAICYYLAEKYPDRGMMPDDLEQRARVHQWIFHCVTELEPPLWRIDRHSFIYPQEKRIAADIELAREDYRRAAAVLDRAMEGRDFVVGDRLSLADIIIGYVLIWSGWEGMLEEFSDLAQYVSRLKERPALPEMLKTPPQDK